MRQTRDLNIGLLASIAAATLAMTGCGPKTVARRCVDTRSAVVSDDWCEDESRRGPVAAGGFYPYRWYYGGSRAYAPPGTVMSGGSYNRPAGVSSFSHPTATGGTTRGMFGGSAVGAGG
jgi:hypothetical protein